MREDVYRLHEHMDLHTWVKFDVKAPEDTLRRTDFYRFCTGCHMLEWYNNTWTDAEWTDCPEIPEDDYWKKFLESAKAAGIDVTTIQRPGFSNIKDAVDDIAYDEVDDEYEGD